MLLLLAGLAGLALAFPLLFLPASGRDSAQSTNLALTLPASVPEASPQNHPVAQEPGSTNTASSAPASAPSDDSRIFRQNIARYFPSEPLHAAVPRNIVAYARVHSRANVCSGSRVW